MISILVVDDSSVARVMARRYLEAAGFDVTEAHDVNSAYRLLTTTTYLPAAIVLDWNMPGGNGLELVGMLTADPQLQRIPVVFATSDADVVHQGYALDAGAVGYVLKPFSAAELVGAVRSAANLG